jgi:signal transduction histidine kinase
MKLQLRFFFLLLAFFLAGSGFLLIQRNFEYQRSQKLLTSELKQRQKYFDNIVSLEGASLKQLSDDYSFWDDMVKYIQTADPVFAQQNLDTGLDTFGVDTYAVYRPDGSLVSARSVNTAQNLKTDKLPADFFKQLKSNKELHFYEDTNLGVLEVRAKTIVPSSDPEHNSEPKGYWIIGRLLQKDYVNKISAFSQTTTTLKDANFAVANKISGDTVSFATPLTDWDGSKVASLSSSSQVALVNELKTQYQQQMQLLGGIFVLLSALIIFSIYWFVLRPIKQISSAIANKDPITLEKLRKTNTEFGNLAQTVKDFFDQKVVLADAEFRKNELEKLNKEKASFLAVAAHELNGPVNNVKMFSEYLEFLITKKRDDEAAITKQVHRLEHQTVKINMLLNDLRSASTGKADISFNIRNFDFDSFLSEEVSEATFSFKHKLNLSGSTGQTINSDPDRLGQVVSNLIRNAGKYSPDADHIDIRTKFQDGQIILEIQDFGVGISEEDQKHVFEKFFRSSEVTGTFPGLGLGLNISKRIVEGLGGKIWVKSVAGQGSTFYASLPLDSSSVIRQSENLAPPQQL